MTPIQQPSPADILQWLQNNHTLHRVVEALYVVDGYQVEITHDGVRIAGPWHGETLFEAYAKRCGYDTSKGREGKITNAAAAWSAEPSSALCTASSGAARRHCTVRR